MLDDMNTLDNISTAISVEAIQRIVHSRKNRTTVTIEANYLSRIPYEKP